MSADWAKLRAGLSPYMVRLLASAHGRALRLHADVITLEHFVGAALEDEDSAAVSIVEHAFADPETVAIELLALSPGVMVVGSTASLPFSTRSLDALSAARAIAVRGTWPEVTPGHVLAAAAGELEDEIQRDLEQAGLTASSETSPGLEGTPGVQPDGPLFKHFSGNARQALSRANRAAHRGREASIGPAQLFLACLEVAGELEGQVGLSHSKARLVLGGRTADLTPPSARELPPDEAFGPFLAALPAGAGSRELLVAAHAHGSDELRQLFERHKVTEALLERASGAFDDPTE